MTRKEMLEHIDVLNYSTDRDAVARSAIVLVASTDPDAITFVREQMKRAEFLARLDNVEDPQFKTMRLRTVFTAIETNPSRPAAQLCVELAGAVEFSSESARMNFLLRALASIRPMLPEAAAVFRQTNREGYWDLNVTLLVYNGSPVALALFEEMMRDTSVDPEIRIDNLHFAVLMHRTKQPVVLSSGRLLSGGLEPEVEIGVIETLFDYRQKPWYGPVCHAPLPPPWSEATDEALRMLLAIAARVQARADLRDELREAIRSSVAEIAAELERRTQ